MELDDKELELLKIRSMMTIKQEMLDRQYTKPGRIFTEILERMTWLQCTKCRGLGVLYYKKKKPGPSICEECIGVGGFRRTFKLNSFRTRFLRRVKSNSNITFMELFRKALLSGEIVYERNSKNGDKLFHNTKSRLEYKLRTLDQP